MTWKVRPPSLRRGWIQPLGLLLATGVALLGSQGVSAEEPTARRLDDDAPRTELDAERAARDTLKLEVERLRATVDQLEASRDATALELRALRERVEALTKGGATAPPVSAGAPPEQRLAPAENATPQRQGRAARPGSRLPPVAASPTDEPESTAPERPEAREPETVGKSKERQARYQAQRDILEQRGGVLLPGGQLVIEPGLSYVNVARHQLQISGYYLFPAFLIGDIKSRAIDRDIYQPALTARYGFHDRLEASVTVPYVFRIESHLVGAEGDETEEVYSANGIGDITTGLFAHVFRERSWIPDIILNARGRVPTGRDPFESDKVPLGSGFWGVSGGATLTKTLDPAVLFVSGRYLWNLERSSYKFGDVDPGDVVEYNLGLAFGLNERLALSSSLQHSIVGAAKVDGSKQLRTRASSAVLFLGMSYVANRWISPNVSVGIGLTDDAVDFQIETRIPFRFPRRLPSLSF